MVVGSPIVLNLIPGGVMPVMMINETDKGYKKEFLIYNGAAPYNLPANVSATIRGTKRDGYGVTEAAEVTSGSNLVRITVTEQMTAVPGPNIFELVFEDTNNLKVATINFIMMVERSALNANTVISDSDIAYAEQVLDQLQSVAAFKAQLDNADADIAELQDVKVQKYDTVAQMKANTALKVGMYARTGGYYAVNDDGGALYRISSTAPSTHYETLANGLYAEHIYDSEIKPEQFGAYGDGTHDDSSAIQAMINSVPEYSVCVFLKTYLCNTGILVTRNVNILMYGRCRFPGTLEYAFRVYGQGARRCKFRLNLACTEKTQTVWASHSIIGLDLWASMENEYDVEIEGFKTGIRLFAGNTNSEVDCTYNKVFIRRIYNCQYAIFLTGGSSGGTMNSGTVAQNTFIGGRIGVQGASYAWLGSEDTDDNSYWAVRSVLVSGRTNNNNSFLACSFEGFGVKEDPYTNRARVSGEMQAGMYLNCRYEGITSIKFGGGAYNPTMFLGGYALENVLPEEYSGTSLGRRTQLAGYINPVVIKRSGSGNQYLEVRGANNSIISAFYGNEFFIPRVCLTSNGTAYAGGDASKAIKLINSYSKDNPVSISEIIEASECRFSNSGHIMYKNHAGTKIFDIQPIYTSVPTNVLPGTMAFVNGRPRWYDGTNWVYADGTVVT